MKTPLLALVALFLLITSCRYESALVSKQNILIDSSALGRWKSVSGKVQGQEMLVLEYTNADYLIQYPIGGIPHYFRAYPATLGDRSLLQTQLIGTSQGPIESKDRKYDVFECRISKSGKELTIKQLNTFVVSNLLQRQSDLKNAFLTNRGHQDLFTNETTFRKVEK